MTFQILDLVKGRGSHPSEINEGRHETQRYLKPMIRYTEKDLSNVPDDKFLLRITALLIEQKLWKWQELHGASAKSRALNQSGVL